MKHRFSVEFSINLCSRSLYRRAFSTVENSKLNSGSIGGSSHQSVERVDFPHQMSLAQTAYRGIARHDPDAVDTLGDERCTCASARCGSGGFAPGVSSANYSYIER
jgi:hypothetical protein